MTGGPPSQHPQNSRGKTWMRTIAGLALLALVVATGLVVRHRLAPKHFMMVSEGQLYRSATLPPEQLVRVVAEYGIRTVVNLRSVDENREPWHAEEAEALAAAGIDLVDLPMYSGHTPGPAIEARWLALLDDADAQPILVHCEYGVVRTGIMVSVFEIEHRGASGEDVFESMPLFGHVIQPEIMERIDGYLGGYAPDGPLHPRTVTGTPN